MKTMRRVTLLLLVLSTLVHVQCSKRKKDNPGVEPRVTIKQSYPPGKYSVVVDMDQKQKIEGEGSPQTMQSTMTIEMLMDVAEPAADGSTVLKMSYSRFAMKGSGMNVDTNGPSPPPGTPQAMADQAYRIMIGHELTMKMSAEGEVLSVSGIESLWEKLAASLPQGGAAMLEGLKGMVNDESLKNVMGGGEEFMPPKAMGDGAVWHTKTTTDAPIIGAIDVDFECEMTELADTPAGKVARIAFNGTMESKGGKSLSVGPAAMEFGEIEMTQEGFIRVNADTGLLVDMEMQQVGTIEMSVQQPGGKKLDMTSDLNQTIKTTITPVE